MAKCWLGHHQVTALDFSVFICKTFCGAIFLPLTPHLFCFYVETRRYRLREVRCLHRV